MKKQSFLFLAFMCLSILNTYSQTNALQKADKKYNDYAYIDAIKIYESIAQKGYKNARMLKQLGNAYYFNSEFEKAAKWYETLFTMKAKIETEYYFRYAQSLKSIGSYGKSDEIMTLFIKKSAHDLRGKRYSENKDYLEVIRQNSGRFIVEDAGINSESSDYGGSFWGNKFIFTTARDSGIIFKRKMKWTNQPFTNLYVSEIKDTLLQAPEKFSKKLNSKVNESSAVFTKDGKTIYFTRNNYIKGKKGKNKNGITLLKLYQADFDGNDWINVIELPFNSDQYSVAHPALSPDEKTLYFASDMPGGYGQSDLYKTTIYDNGKKFGAPENLGRSINTEGKETFPFVSDDNELYFASDGHPGLGGLDIFQAKMNENGTFRKINNVGEPVNSKWDDFAFLINSESRTGFFSSDRKPGNGFDDIYKFTETLRLKCEQVLEGILKDAVTNEPIPEAKLVLYDTNRKELQIIYTSKDGSYSFGKIECGSFVFIKADKKDYETTEIPYFIPESTNFPVPISIKKRIVKIEIGTDLANVLSINRIHFDLDKANIREEAAFELAKILTVMKEYPSMKIDVRSHTDSRQSKDYNLKLSDRRAKATIAWLIENGIEPERLTGKGYGETQLINKCADNVLCSEEEHQMNRRSQFIITAI